MSKQTLKEKYETVLLENKHLRKDNAQLREKVCKVKEMNTILRNRYADAIKEIKELLNLERNN